MLCCGLRVLDWRESGVIISDRIQLQINFPFSKSSSLPVFSVLSHFAPLFDVSCLQSTPLVLHANALYRQLKVKGEASWVSIVGRCWLLR